LITIERDVYQNHFRKNELFHRPSINETIWNNTPKLNDFGINLKNKIASSFELIQYSKG
jgi:hypothetical protein